MTDNPYLFPQPQKKYRWSYQFGLYRYDSDDHRTKYRNILMKPSNIQYFAILAMFGISILVICFLMYTASSTNDIEEQLLHETTLEEYPLKFQTHTSDINNNSSITIQTNSSTVDNVTAEKLIQSLPNFHTPTHSTTLPSVQDDLVAMESNKNDDKFHPLYFDEYIPNMRPPPKIIQQIRRNYVLPPNPFRFISAGPRPQAFQMYRKNDRKIPQINENYRYPQNAMNIQDIIKYLTNKRSRKLNKVAFSGKFQNINSDSSIQVNRNQNDNGLLLSEEQQLFNDPFYKYKPSDPSDINLLAPNQFRFAPSLLQNHRFVPTNNEDIPNTQLRKAKPVSVMLDIYPMPDENDEVDKYGMRKPIYLRPINNPSNNYNNLNSLYHFSNYPNRQPIIVPRTPTNIIQKNKNSNSNIYDVKGYHYNNAQRYNPQLHPESHSTENDLEKMVVHLNLYPRKKIRHNPELQSTKSSINFDDALYMESSIRNTTIPVSDTEIDNITNETSQMNNNYSGLIQDEINNLKENRNFIHNQFSYNQEENPTYNRMLQEMQMTSMKETNLAKPPIYTTTSENPKIFIFSPQVIDKQKNYVQNHSNIDITSNEQNSHIQFINNIKPIQNSSKYSTTLEESEFHPMKFSNISFPSESLDKNFMAGIQEQYARKEFTKYKNFETPVNSSEMVVYYEPLLINSDNDRSDTIENDHSDEESNNYMPGMLHSFEVNTNLRNHKPFFSEVNDSLKSS